MDKKIAYVAVIAAVLVVAAVGAYLVIDGEDGGTRAVDMGDVELKVYGNINGDRFLDLDDAGMIQDIIDEGADATEYPLADADRDGVLDGDDVALVEDVAAGRPAVIWHVNFHDVDGDGTMDEEIVSTSFPVTSALTTGSSNTLTMEMMLGLTDHIKGASYGNTNDMTLLGATLLDTDRVERLGTSTMSIPFEDGKVGSSNIIAEEGVTTVIADWNRSYLTNEADFEKAGVDVVRVSAAAAERDEIVHSYMLLGLLFQETERADELVDLMFSVFDYVEDNVDGEEWPVVAASSSNGQLSSAGSDYTRAALMAGGTYGLGSVDFAGSTGIKIADHPEVYLLDFEYIFHIRNQLSYNQTAESVSEDCPPIVAYFDGWKHADTGQYIVCSTMPICLRVAYIATALHPDTVDIDKVDALHQELVDRFYECGTDFDISGMRFILTPEDMADL